jgi:hypothetical protein
VSSGTFETTSFGWQLQQLQQRLSEGVERFFARNNQADNGFPNWQIPDWLQTGLFWLLVFGLVGWASWQLYAWLRPYIRPYVSRSRALLNRSPLPNSSHAVPSSVEWVRQSRRAHQQGNDREACRLLYMAALQQLHEVGLVSQEPSRTDGEYLHLTQNLPSAPAYQTLLRIHEQVCFSDAAISADLFNRCWQAYRDIENSTLQP